MSNIQWGISEQTNGMMGILLNIPGGVVTPFQMQMIAQAAGEDGIIKNTRRMSMVVLVPRERLDKALLKLDQAGLMIAALHGSIRNVVACAGKGFSANSRGDTLGLAQEINKEFYGIELPYDFKIGISGCPRNCSGVQCHDLGLMAENRGKYSLWLGGSEAGMSPEHGKLIQKGIPCDKVIPVIQAVLNEYSKSALEVKDTVTGRPKLYRIIAQVGSERFEQSIKEALK